MNKSEQALIKKDIQELLSNKQVLLPMIIVPLLFVVIFPSVLLVGAQYVTDMDSNVFTDIEPLIKQLQFDSSAYTPAQLLIKITVDFLFPPFFLIISILSSSVMGASSFVGEKEHHTIESLFYTPISMERLLRAKIFGVFLPSFVVTLFSFLIFTVIINVGGLVYFDHLIFPTVQWLLIVGWLSPALSMLSLVFTALVSAKANSFQGAQQISGLLVLPVILLLVGQTSGLFLLNDFFLVVIGSLMFLVDFFLIKQVSKRFSPEKLI